MQVSSTVRRRLFGVAIAGSAALAVMLQAGAIADAKLARGSFHQTNLVSDIPGLAQSTDANLKNPWGLSSSPTSPIWVSDNNAGVSTLYLGDGSKVARTVTIPAPDAPTGGTPTGTVFNSTPSTTTDFTISSGGKSGKALFLFATEDGTILGWNPGVGGNSATITVDNSAVPDAANGAVYKGLALGTSGTNNYLYATNFRSGKVDVFDKDFHQVLAGTFNDPSIPAGFAPFGVQNIGGQIFVTYAK
ncbi:MAG: hypothetical protein QOI23_951, partial [Chloroflexota bacterium]|nr:hypothetical protein [Chloroflexota bacterium]